MDGSAALCLGRDSTQQEDLARPWRCRGKSQGISDKLIRAGILNLAGRNGDQLTPGRALDLISVRDVLDAVRADEDGIVRRLPGVLPRLKDSVTKRRN